MKKQLLLCFFSFLLLTSAQAQKKAQRITAYAITGAERGGQRWTEVNLVDASTGEVISQVYQSKNEVQRLNARTGKPITIASAPDVSQMRIQEGVRQTSTLTAEGIVIVKKERIPLDATVNSTATSGGVIPATARKIIIRKAAYNKEDPFATTSAACALDAKHNRLYYTPMGINQLRYIDLKSKTISVYYFENETFGTVTGMGDVNNQITRMVIASDGNGYALTNDAKQLIQFTTKKKPVITNLGAITDDPANGKFIISSRNAYGGDMVADEKGSLYLITANRRVYQIPLETKVAKYLGSIKGLPEGYTTNGAVVEKGSRIIVSSSSSTTGYYAFDLKDMQAEKLTSASVYNASDLANDKLITFKKKKEDKPVEIVQQDVLAEESKLVKAVEKSISNDVLAEPRLSVYPNPITDANTKVSLYNYPQGLYSVQLYDLSGRLINKIAVQVANKTQVVDYILPAQLAKGSYFLQVLNGSNTITGTEKIIVQ